ncbi:SGNH/GDSL hydrolase family protein [Kocuria rosea]|uniref:SGNH/GDSL hydrolase family protein n=1 Tax=Kocuria rosea TaxID=1275 RepID=UPI003D330923
MDNRKFTVVVTLSLLAALALVAGGLQLATGAYTTSPIEPAPASKSCNETPPPNNDRLVVGVIGDSYTGGTSMGGKGNDSWAEKLTGMLSADMPVDVQPIAYGGSGYINVGPFKKTFVDALLQLEPWQPDIIVIFGSINDNGQNPEQLYQTATNVYNRARVLYPNSQMMVIGPTWHLESQAVHDNSAAVLSAAQDAHIPTFDPLPEKWFVLDRDNIAADGVHPTSAGHTLMAQRIAPHVQDLIDAQPNLDIGTIFRPARQNCR